MSDDPARMNGLNSQDIARLLEHIESVRTSGLAGSGDPYAEGFVKACDICINALRAAATVDEETDRRKARTWELGAIDPDFDLSEVAHRAREEAGAGEKWPPDWQRLLENLVRQIEMGDWIDHVGHNVKMNTHFINAVTAIVLANAGAGHSDGPARL